MAEQMSICAAVAKKICYYVTFKAALRSFVCKEVGAMYLSRAEFCFYLQCGQITQRAQIVFAVPAL